MPPLRTAVHGLWIGPVVAAGLVTGTALYLAAADTDQDFAGAGGAVVLVLYAVVLTLPVAVLAGAASGLVGGLAAWRLTRVPPWARAVVGGVAAAAVAATILAAQPDRTWHGVLGVLALVGVLVTGGGAVLAEGRTAARRHRAWPWLAACVAVGLAAWGVLWLSTLRFGEVDRTVGNAPPRDLTPPSAQPSAPAGPAPAAPASLAAGRRDLATLAAEATAAGGPDLLWPAPPAVTEIACTDDGGAAGTILELGGRYTTRDLATASDDVDFLHITQANEKVAARIAAAWTAGRAQPGDTLHGEYWVQPAAPTTVDQAHLGFDQGVGTLRVTTRCATQP